MSDILVTTDQIDVQRALALAGVLGAPTDAIREGAVLPAMWQLAYFLPRPAQSELGQDGHPREGFPTPPRPGMRRMFAGGRLHMSPGIRLGTTAVARTSVHSQREKQGRSGPMTFVTTRTEIHTESGDLALLDERDLVYLPLMPPASSAADRPAPGGDVTAEADDAADSRRHVEIDPTLLFRFSALTYNAHRIHYDADYARDVERYPGLVVHGPLQAVLMAEQGRQPLGSEIPLHMSYKLVAPLCAGQGLTVGSRLAGRCVQADVRDSTGRVTATAALSWRRSDLQVAPGSDG